ncbi:zinc finger protein 271-like [Penaeus monodon]|uniref:zinc finger protein 271-like n=1 Tax=Penaeus monodon TaxID=6687 RepID=UPI0018A7144F|nr:zinc finger protein 271-like [Penaeus monodon]
MGLHIPERISEYIQRRSHAAVIFETQLYHEPYKSRDVGVTLLLVTMSFLADWMPLAPLMDEEIYDSGVSIKEELNDISEDSLLEIKEEQFDYGDEERNEVSDKKVEHECLFFHNLDELRHEAYTKDTCGSFQDGNCMLLRASFVSENFLNRGSSDRDQAIQERLQQDMQPKVEAKLKRFECEVCGKKFSRKRYINIHMRVHTKEKPYSCEICNKTFSQTGNLVKHMRVHRKEKPFNRNYAERALH